jgi:5-carboxymethyl-2-hydroxymuconate isomerase
MPHLIIDCTDRLLAAHGAAGLIATVFDVARDSGLFAVQDIKVRIRPYADFVTGGSDDDFLHVFAYIMQGRTIEQRNEFSKAVVSALKKLLPDVPVISMNVMEFEKATYNNRKTVG